MEIFIQVYTGDTLSFKKVEAEPLIIKGFEEYRFFTHRDYTMSALWNVSEAATGAMIQSGFSKEEAIFETQNKLDEKGKEALDKMIKEKISLTGKIANPLPL